MSPTEAPHPGPKQTTLAVLIAHARLASAAFHSAPKTDSPPPIPLPSPSPADGAGDAEAVRRRPAAVGAAGRAQGALQPLRRGALRPRSARLGDRPGPRLRVRRVRGRRGPARRAPGEREGQPCLRRPHGETPPPSCF